MIPFNVWAYPRGNAGTCTQQQRQTGIVTAEITERLCLLLLVNPDFGHNGRGWY